MSDWSDLPAAPEVFQIEVGMLQNFCEILYCPDTHEAAVVDPAWEVDTLLREARRLDVRITQILITHTHNDHIEGVDEMVALTNATVVVHPSEEKALSPIAQPRIHVRDRLDIAIGRRGVRALETSGHTVGGTCYLADGYVVTGDVLFVGGCGRTDFTGGDTAAMWRSLQRLAALPEETRVYPGHNYGTTPTSSISRELLENRFLLCKTYEDFRALREKKRG
jgi:hydroxyacylglutathione hydrolase